MTPEEFIATIVREIVQRPDKVEVKNTMDEHGLLYTIKVDDNDAKLVIGRKGKTINLIKDLIYIFGARRGQRMNVVLDVPEKPR